MRSLRLQCPSELIQQQTAASLLFGLGLTETDTNYASMPLMHHRLAHITVGMNMNYSVNPN